MLTVFALPKPFIGVTARLQRNALRTWVGLAGAEVILFGDEPGEAEAAAEAGCRVGGDVAVNELGTPLLDDLFLRAEMLGRNRHLCFVNGDILLPPSLVDALGAMWSELPRAVGVGQCLNLLVEEEVSWSGLLEAEARSRGALRGPGGIDYVAFPRGTFAEVPAFALGRAGFDNWLIWDARRRGIPVVDLTAVVPAVHQDHDYSHLAGGRQAAYEGPEARRNIELAGGELHLFNIDDATHRLTTAGLRANRLAALRGFAPARWTALRWGELERAVARRVAGRQSP